MKSRTQTTITIVIEATIKLGPDAELVRALLASLPPPIRRAVRRYMATAGADC